MRAIVISADRSDPNGNSWNVGDSFLVDVLLNELKSQGFDAIAVDFGGVRKDGSPRRFVAGFPELSRLVAASDLVVVGGGTMLQDDQKNRKFGGLPRLCLAARIAALIHRKPMAYFGVGCDPVLRLIPRLTLRAATVGVPVYVRDRDSLERAKGLRADAALTADACLLPASSDMVPTGGSRSGVLLALNFAHSAQLATLAERAAASGRPASAIAMSQGPTLNDLEGVQDQDGLTLVRYPLTWHEALEKVAASELVVASRMHALYMALLTNTPMIAIGTSAKVVAFADEFEVPIFANPSDVVLELGRTASSDSLLHAKRRASEGLRATAKLSQRLAGRRLRLTV